MPEWDPDAYQRFAAERARPFTDLLARVVASDPRTVLDLGCGPGTLTSALADRWPGAQVRGVDSSPAMVAAAAPLARPGLAFGAGDVREVDARGVDVLVANAVLQWVPGYLGLLRGWVRGLAPGGWLALQVPGNLDAPSHTVLRELAAEPPFAPSPGTQGPGERVAAPGPAAHLDALLDADADGDADVWETTYLHLLAGPDPVLGWLLGTGARPVVQAMAARDAGLAREFTAELGRRLAAEYPPGPGGTVFPFRRVFAVAHRRDAA